MKVELHLEKWFVNARGWYLNPVKMNYTAPKTVAGVWRWLFFGWVYKPNK